MYTSSAEEYSLENLYGGVPEMLEPGLIDAVYQALIGGREGIFREKIYELYRSQIPLHTIFDDLITPAFRAIGDAWRQNKVRIFQEKMGTEMCSRLLYEMRTEVMPLSNGGPVALGATLPGDTYDLALHMVELALRNARWQAQSLGTNLPGETLAAAIRHMRPQLFWLCLSYVEDQAALMDEYQPILEASKETNCKIIIGGRAATPEVCSMLPDHVHCTRISDLIENLPSD